MARQAFGDQGERRPGIRQFHADDLSIALTDIQPGKPQQNACVERHNRTVRHAWLVLTIFEAIKEVQQIAAEWLRTYNDERPNIGIGGVTPVMKLEMAA